MGVQVALSGVKKAAIFIAALGEEASSKVFKHLHDNRTGGHEVDEFAEEGAFLVHGVECASLIARHVDALLGNNAEARLFDHSIYCASEVTGRAIGLQNRKSALERHGQFPYPNCEVGAL